MFNTINCIYNYILLSFTTNLNFIRYVCSKRGDILLKRYVLIFALILLTINAADKQESTYRSKVLPDLKEKNRIVRKGRFHFERGNLKRRKIPACPFKME